MERWKINLYTIWFTQTMSLISCNLALPFIPYYIQELGVTDPGTLRFYTGILSAAPALGMGLMAPVWGMLADRYGKKLMLLRAVFFSVIVLGGMALSTRVWHVFLFRIIQGLFTGTATAASAFIASNTPNNRLSYSLGFFSSSSFIGQSAGPAIGGILADLIGYRTSFLIGAIAMVADFFLLLLLVKEEKTSHTRPKSGTRTLSSIFSVLSFSILILFAILFFIGLSRSSFGPYLSLYVQEIRDTVIGSSRITGLISSFAAFMSALSGIIVGKLADKYNRYRILMCSLIAGILISTALLLHNGLLYFMLFYGIMMFTLGGIEPIIMAITSGLTPPEKRGALFGFYALIGSIGWGVSPLIGTYISINFSIRAILTIIPVFLSLALIVLFLSKSRIQQDWTI